MNSDNELKINIKNHACYHFEDIIKINDLNFENILIDEKPNETILIYNDATNKTLYGETHMVKCL